jgi:uncharacterized protein
MDAQQIEEGTQAGSGAARAPRRPSRHKLALVTWVGAYGVITLILHLLGPLMAPWPLALRTLLLSGLMVSLLSWVVIPVLTWLVGGWLHAPKARWRPQ